MDPALLYLTYLLAGSLVGFLIAYLVVKYRYSQTHISRLEVSTQYKTNEIYDQLQDQADLAQEDLREKEQEIRQLQIRLTQLEADNKHHQLILQDKEKEFKQLQEQARLQFESIANRLMEEKSQKFTAQNKDQLEGLLKPLKEKIKEFEEGIERKLMDDTKEKLSLKLAIEQLNTLNTQLSDDANRLVNALRGDNKMQGDWGEYQLELLLEKAGLEKDIHFFAQNSFKDENGKEKRPDFLIQLPEDKWLIIDCKVSLVAYDRFYQSETEEEQKLALKEHINSLRQHVKNLSSKRYEQLYDIQSPDYTLLYVPIETAYTLAVREDQQLFLEALEKNVVVVTASTLLATMRTVSFIWKQDKQKRSVLEIAKQSGLLYDKFVNFVEDLRDIGYRLDQANSSYHAALHKLKNGKRYGDTLIGRAERIRKLGANASKQLPPEFQLDSPENEEDNLLEDGH
jgi:DNA recombination protein RmuC